MLQAAESQNFNSELTGLLSKTLLADVSTWILENACQSQESQMNSDSFTKVDCCFFFSFKAHIWCLPCLLKTFQATLRHHWWQWKWCSHCGRQIAIGLRSSTPRYIHWRIKHWCSYKICLGMFTSIVTRNSQKMEAIQIPPSSEWINKIHTMEYYSAI